MCVFFRLCICRAAGRLRGIHFGSCFILRNHLETCVTESFQSRKRADRKEKIEELIRVFEGMRPK